METSKVGILQNRVRKVLTVNVQAGRSVYDFVTIPGWQWRIETFHPEGYELESPEDFAARIRKWFKARFKDSPHFSFHTVPNWGANLQDFLSEIKGRTNTSKDRLNYLIVTHGEVA